MPTDHPFQSLFETFGKLPDAHSDKVNREAREAVKNCLDVPLGKPGHCVLLKAPRAGHGKTHLLTRLQHELGGTHEFVPLHAVGGSRIDAATVLDDTLRRLVRGLPAAGGLTVLDLVARRLFSVSLQPLVNSGEVPCQDRDGALNALRSRPIETFDFHHPSAVTAHWARENFELLGPRLALELSQRNALSLREVSFWVDAMFRFAATPIDNPGRSRALAVTVFSDPTSEIVAHERLIALLGLMTSLMRVVLVADEVEGFSSDETAALRFASFLGALRQSVPKVDVVLSVNQDVWESAFLPRLSGGLADRLSEVVVELEPLDREMMLAILDSRAEGDGEKILGKLDSDSLPTHARGLIREAARKWMEAEKENAGKESSAPELSIASSLVTPGFAEEPATPVQEDLPDIPPSDPAPQDFPPPSPPVEDAPEMDFLPPSEEYSKPAFSAEAAISAFKGFQESEPESIPDEVPEVPAFSLPVVEEIPSEPVFQSSSWPDPAVSVSKFQAAPAESGFAPAASPPESAFTSRPAENPFQAVPEPALQPSFPEDAPFPPATPHFQPAEPIAEVPPQAQEHVSVFQAAAPAPEIPVQAFQPSPEPAIVAETPDEESHAASSTDRVDDLLRQFRERYGKS